MKMDAHLRVLVKAIRKANASGSPADFKQVKALHSAYMSSCRALDVEAAIAELDDWGTTENPRDISPELRHALILFLARKIGAKRGRKPGTASSVDYGIRSTIAAQAAHAYQDPRLKDQRMTRSDAKVRAAREFNVNPHTIDAKLSPRKRTGKT